MTAKISSNKSRNRFLSYLMVTACFLFSFKSVWSQHTIDHQKSFFGLEFESMPQDLSGNLQLDLIISYGLEYYKYRSKKLKEVYGQKIHQINLGFRDEKLEYIDIYFSKLKAVDFLALTDSLENDFGIPINIEPFEKGIIEAVRWQDKNTTLDFYRYGPEAVDTDDINKSVIAVSRPHK